MLLEHKIIIKKTHQHCCLKLKNNESNLALFLGSKRVTNKLALLIRNKRIKSIKLALLLKNKRIQTNKKALLLEHKSIIKKHSSILAINKRIKK